MVVVQVQTVEREASQKPRRSPNALAAPAGEQCYHTIKLDLIQNQRNIYLYIFFTIHQVFA